MKIHKVLLFAAAALFCVLPLNASAQGPLNEAIGSLQNVNGNVYIQRRGEILRAINDSAVLPLDKVVAEPGASAVVNLTGSNGRFQPCYNVISNGTMVAINSANYCADLARLQPIGPNDAFLTAASNVPRAVYNGPPIGTALPTTALAAILGAGALATGLVLILNDSDDDDDDGPTSP